MNQATALSPGDKITVRTFCNPVNLPYRFALEDYQFRGKDPGREAADPFLVRYQGKYWLFASKCGAYFWSDDLVDWKRIVPTGFPIEEFAPSVCVIRGKMYAVVSNYNGMWATDDPMSGKWTQVRLFDKEYADPDLFRDDDGRVYLYWGSSPDKPIYGIELDVDHNFDFIGEPTVLIDRIYPESHGWEDRNPLSPVSKKLPPWIEGSTVIKHNGCYYLQYSAPGTEERDYADGIIVAKSPLGPYHYELYSPAVYKRGGYIGSTGHGGSAYDKDGICWRVATMVVRIHFDFERRIGMFPVSFLDRGDGSPDQYYCNTYLGDYPQLVPGSKANPAEDNLAGWMLLSFRKNATASSVLSPEHGIAYAFNEEIETSWAAAKDDPAPWLSVDLGKECLVCAMQINFADVFAQIYGKLEGDAYQYYVESSLDGNKWDMLIDRRNNTIDAPHDYIQLENVLKTRFLRLHILHAPAGAVASVSGFRVFGSGLSALPEQVSNVTVERDTDDRRIMKVSWNPVLNADFYVIRYGVRPDILNLHEQVPAGASSFRLFGLNTEAKYYATVDTVNDTGITQGPTSVSE